MSFSKLLGSFFEAPKMSQKQALLVSERIVAAASTISSLEYLTQHKDMDPGGLNDWEVIKSAREIKNRNLLSFISQISEKPVTVSIHFGRLLSSFGLVILPADWEKTRGALNLFNAMGTNLLAPRHRFGTDGSDQVTMLINSFNGLARFSSKPKTKDALLWGLSLQLATSYSLSGFVKLFGPTWRDGSALPGIMRTKTYGSEKFYRFIKRHPGLDQKITTVTLIFECAFPLAYFFKGRLAKPALLTGFTFHLANAVLMGLGRFLIAFPAMYPAFAYTVAPSKRASATPHRDNSVPLLTAIGFAPIAVGAWLTNKNRRAISKEGWPTSKTITTRHGNTYTYEWGGNTSNHSKPIFFFTPALAATAEYYAWITESLAYNHEKSVIAASRPGYAASIRNTDQIFTLEEAIDDLQDLVSELSEEDQPVILVGHSYGGELMRRLALRLGKEKTKAIIYLDPTHPAELMRSTGQRDSAEKVSDGINRMRFWLKLGTGFLLKPPSWLQEFPHNYREKIMAHYSDPELWDAALREWEAMYQEMLEHVEPTEIPEVPALLIAAGTTIHYHPEQLEMYKELVPGFDDPLTPSMQLEIINGADHDSLLSNHNVAEQVVMTMVKYASKLEDERNI